MPSTGDKFPTSGTNVDHSGATAWTNPGNITADDASVASCTVASGTTTDYLVASGFDFSSIPDGVTILGITVKVEWRETTSASDTPTLQLQDDTSTLIGSAKTGSDPGSSFTVQTYGSTSDTWSATLTAATVKSSNFGVRMYVDAGGGGAGDVTAEVDYITMAIEYVPRGGLFFGML